MSQATLHASTNSTNAPEAKTARTSDQRAGGKTVPGPRRVRWRRAHARAILVGALVCLLCVGAVALIDLLKGKQTIKAEHKTESTIARITLHWKTGSGKSTRYWVGYRYPQLPANRPDEEMEITNALLWTALTPGQSLAIKYVPADPEVNRLQGNQSHLFERWARTAAVVSAVVIGVPLLIYGAGWRRKRREFWLVQHGKTVVGEVVDISETMIPHGNTGRWLYEIVYRFPGPDGKLITGLRKEAHDRREGWEMGKLVTVFFDPRNPGRHALYKDLPAEVMSSEG